MKIKRITVTIESEDPAGFSTVDKYHCNPETFTILESEDLRSLLDAVTDEMGNGDVDPKSVVFITSARLYCSVSHYPLRDKDEERLPDRLDFVEL